MAIQTLYHSDKGADFIKKINDNFSECQTGSASDGSVSLRVPLQGGELKSETGYVDGKWCVNVQQASNSYNGTWTDDNFYKYLHTPLYLSLDRNNIKNVVVPTGSTMTIFCYNAAFEKTAAVSAVDSIPAATAYVKFQFYKSSWTNSTPKADLHLTLAAQPQWVKNAGPALNFQYFNFECKPPKLWDDADLTSPQAPHEMPTDDTADADSTRYHDNGCVILPPDYTPTGKPCKVIIWFGGDNNSTFINHTTYSEQAHTPTGYEATNKYFATNGYAVAMCSGFTSMWSKEEGAAKSSLWCARLTPAYIAAIRAFYDHIMLNYNFEPAVYLGAKSAGGSMLLHTATTRPFPIRAAAGLSVIISMIDTMRYSYVNTQKSIQKRWGCSNWNDFTIASSGHGKNVTQVHNASGASAAQIADANRLLANKEIYRKLEPFTIGSDIDWDAFVTQNLLLKVAFNDGADYPTALTDIIFAAKKEIKTPIKFWCATLDASVPYTWHKIMVDWIVRSGGIAEMRTYTGNDGAHGTFDGAAHAVTVTTQDGTEMNVPLGAIEIVEWFKRW